MTSSHYRRTIGYDSGEDIYETRRREFDSYDRKLDRELGTENRINRGTRLEAAPREPTTVTVEHW